MNTISPTPAPGHTPPAPRAPMWLNVPIRSLGPAHRERIRAHLLALDPQDRYLRFGYAATDEQIDRYVTSLDFDRDDIFGIYNRKLELLAIAHLAQGRSDAERSWAEFGVSVLKKARGRRYGTRLFDRAVMHARNEGIKTLFIHALTENTAMLRIARNSGARVERDGSESEAFLALPDADLDSRVQELVQEQLAQFNYRIKSQAHQFKNMVKFWLPPSSSESAAHEPTPASRHAASSHRGEGGPPAGASQPAHEADADEPATTP